MEKRLDVAHLAAHVGGGVGSVLRDFFSSVPASAANHHLICLDKCLSNFDEMQGLESRRESQGQYIETIRTTFLDTFDVVVLHYWNHPLISSLLAKGLSGLRLLLWSHNSGHSQPHIIPSYLLRSLNTVCFSSRCSLEAPNVKAAFQDREQRFPVIHSTRSLDSFFKIGRSRVHSSRKRRLLYVGTVSDAKLHPHAARLFARLSRQGFEVVVVGGPDGARLASDVASLGGACHAAGHVSDPSPFFSHGDIFVYPLRPNHYGTGEQVILEAMASGLPIVAFDNPAEAAIVEHGISGLLATSEDEFVRFADTLLKDDNLYASLSLGAFQSAAHSFDHRYMANRLMSEVFKAASMSKVPVHAQFREDFEDVGLAVFVLNSFFDEDWVRQVLEYPFESADLVFEKICPDLDNMDVKGIWLNKTKSSPFHYFAYFPGSSGLRALCDRISRYTSTTGKV